jgi:Zn finger protein HypA/HybF involved in hydrogenase expression
LLKFRCSECGGVVEQSGNKYVCTKCKRTKKLKKEDPNNLPETDMSETKNQEVLFG